ncbi:MAG: cation-translocating P-type ATPase [Massiliimalia sp.]
MKPVYSQTKQEVFEQLSVTAEGLTSKEAEKRQNQYGKNQIQEGNKKSAFQVFLEQFADFLVIILIIAAIVSMFLGDVEGAVVILAIITVNAILGTIQHLKAEQSLDSLKAMSAPQAKVLRDGETKVIPSEEVTLGDVVLLEAGDYICADGRILENYSLKVNESSLTGESLSIEKTDQVLPEGDVPLGDRKNMVYSGSFVTYGRASFVVTGIGMDTELGHVAQLLKNTKEKKTPLQVNLDNFGKKLSIAILVLCAILFAVSIYRGEPIMNAFLFAVALAVAAIPEALSSIVTIVLSFGTQKMARENAIIRKLQAVEGLGSVSIICSDKTGTLTQNKMTVKKYYVDGKVVEDPDTNWERPMDHRLLLMGVLCNDASNKDGQPIGDPTEVAMVDFTDRHGAEDELVLREQYPRLSEVPFDSDRKLMSTVHCIDGTYRMMTKGAVDVLLSRADCIRSESGVRPITEEDREQIAAVNQQFSENGLRVLAFCERELEENQPITIEDETHMTFVGLIAMMDPPREESKQAVAECIGAGIRPVMITGDHKVTAAAIARQIGILQDGMKAVDGMEIDAMSDEELKDYVDQVAVYARVSPEHKIRIVRAWQQKGFIVSMTGDGVNDAPALKQADVGVAMGITGSEVAKDAASMVLTDDNFATIVKAIENGRNVYANIKKAIRFLLSGNMAAILAVLFSSLLALPVPFAAVHLLFINLLTDGLPAIALGLEPHTSEVMKEKPRDIHESILTKEFIAEVLIQGLVICAGVMTAFWLGNQAGGAGLASTMAFATLCLGRILHSFTSKARKPVLFRKMMFNNRYLNGAVVLDVVLLAAALLVPPIQGIFQVTPMTGAQLGIVVLSAVGAFLVNQLIWGIRELIRRK